MQDKVIEAKSQHQSIAGHPVFVWIHPRDTANISHKPEEPWLIQWFSFSRQDGTAIRIWENTPRWADCRSADDEVTIKCAYRRNCCILDNDNYKDISRKASLSLSLVIFGLDKVKRDPMLQAQGQLRFCCILEDRSQYICEGLASAPERQQDSRVVRFQPGPNPYEVLLWRPGHLSLLNEFLLPKFVHFSGSDWKNRMWIRTLGHTYSRGWLLWSSCEHG